MTTKLWVLAGILGIVFIAFGVMKFVRVDFYMNAFMYWGYSDWFRVVVGILEILGGIGLFVPHVNGYVAAGLGVIMAGAIYTHIASAELEQAPLAVILFALLGWLAHRERNLNSLRRFYEPSTAH